MEFKETICHNPKCGRPFKKTWYTQNYCCMACRKRARQIKAQEERKSTRLKIIAENGMKPRETVAEVNAKARAEGLSYGQYFNKHGYGGWF